MTESSFAVTSGARIGWIGASWPMARLSLIQVLIAPVLIVLAAVHFGSL